MTEMDFKIQMGRLYSVWGEKSFQDEKLKIIAAACKDLSYSQFERIISHFLSTFRQAPLPKDFLDAAIRERHNSPHNNSAYSPAPAPDCDKCYDCGVFEVQEAGAPEIYFVRCTCYAGHTSLHPELPMWSYSIHGKEFTPLYMSHGRSKVWMPKNGISGLNEIVEIWKAQKRASLRYWQKWDQVKREARAEA